jgi:hypothetical protein
MQKLLILFLIGFSFSCAPKPVLKTDLQSTEKSEPIQLVLKLTSGALDSVLIDNYSNNGLDKQGVAYNLKVILHPVTNKSEGLKYIFNRRMLLHQNFQNEIAPYFGVITLNQDCLKLVDTKGDLIEPNKNESYTKLSFAAKSDYTLFDCASDQFSTTLTYYFHYCANKKTVYETRFSKKIAADVGLNISCQ